MHADLPRTQFHGARAHSTADLLSASCRRSFGLASGRRRRDLALVRRRAARGCASTHHPHARQRARRRPAPARRRPARRVAVPPSLGDWTLVGCTVAPGFLFAHFELGAKEGLAALAFRLDGIGLVPTNVGYPGVPQVADATSGQGRCGGAGRPAWVGGAVGRHLPPDARDVQVIFRNFVRRSPSLVGHGQLIAVGVFFVISGHVLTIRRWRRPEQQFAADCWSCGRYLRLEIPILAASLIYLALMLLHLRRRRQEPDASSTTVRTGSAWAAPQPRSELRSAPSGFSLCAVTYCDDARGELRSTSLYWTMIVELWGSLIVPVAVA